MYVPYRVMPEIVLNVVVAPVSRLTSIVEPAPRALSKVAVIFISAPIPYEPSVLVEVNYTIPGPGKIQDPLSIFALGS